MRTEGYQPVEGAKEFVSHLHDRRVKMAVASSSPFDYICHATDSLNIAHCFIDLISGESLNRPKPAPDVFLKAAQALSADPKRCVVVEDSTNGIKAAKSAGMFCIAFKNPNSGSQDLSLADIVVDSFDSLSHEKLIALFEEYLNRT